MPAHDHRELVLENVLGGFREGDKAQQSHSPSLTLRATLARKVPLEPKETR
jgi:hypothetical protein